MDGNFDWIYLKRLNDECSKFRTELDNFEKQDTKGITHYGNKQSEIRDIYIKQALKLQGFKILDRDDKEIKIKKVKTYKYTIETE